MSTITLQNFRVGSDLTVKVRLKDGGVAIDWSTLSGIRAVLYSDAQSSIAGRCDVTVDGEDPTLLVCRYAATKMQYLGVNRIVVSAKYMGETKTYDKPAFTFVRWTADQEGEQITIEDPEVTVEIDVEDVSSSILQEAVNAAFSAADRANEAAEAAEHMVDIKTGPAGKSPYKGENGNWFEWDEEAGQYVDTGVRAKGETGDTPDISIGTVTTVEPGEPAAASMSGTPEAPVLNLSIPKGAVGSTPNISIGTVTTGAPGTPVVITITGTAEAPVLNITIPQGMKGDTGVSADYPITIYNGLDSDATDAALAAAQGKVLDGKISQLQQELGELIPYADFEKGSNYTFWANTIGTNNAIDTISTAGEDKVIAVAANSILKIKANANYPALVIFLTVKTFNYGHKPSTAGTFANGYTTGFVIPVDTEQEFKIDTDCYLHIMEGANQSYWPTSIMFRDATGAIQELFDKTDELAEDVQENADAISDTNERIDTIEETTPDSVGVASILDVLHYSSGDAWPGVLSEDGTYKYQTLNRNRYDIIGGIIERGKAVAGKYKAFAKFIVEGPDDSDTYEVTFWHQFETEMLSLVCPVNVLQMVYLGEVDDSGSATNNYYFRTSQFGPSTTKKDYTLKLYGIYLIKVADYPNLPNVATLLDYTKTVTYFTSLAMESAHTFNADNATEATRAVNADNAIVAGKIETPIKSKRIGCYGDSLVTYSSQSLSGVIGGYLNATVSLVGQGGGATNNNIPSIKHGFCTIERMALMPRNMKVLVFWGGANDGYLFVNDGVVDPARLGTINDKPLGVADMFNYRVTDNNVTVRDTPGRTQTFYQAYQTFIRNAQILFPNTLLICVSQYRAYQYSWPHYDQVALKVHWPQLHQAEKECAEKWATAFCDLYVKSGISDGNCFTWLIDDGGSLIHPWVSTAERCANLILQTILENYNVVEPEHQVTLRDKDKDVAELKEYLVDLRSESEINVMTFEEAVPAFIQYCTDNNITLKNNMYLVFYNNQYGNSVGYFLIDYTNPSASSSWEEWVKDVVFDMRTAIDTATGELYGVQTLAQAAVNFNEKATLEQWQLTNDYYMYFYISVGSWEKYRLTTPSNPTASSSWTKVGEGTDN